MYGVKKKESVLTMLKPGCRQADSLLSSFWPNMHDMNTSTPPPTTLSYISGSEITYLHNFFVYLTTETIKETNLVCLV